MTQWIGTRIGTVVLFALLAPLLAVGCASQAEEGGAEAQLSTDVMTQEEQQAATAATVLQELKEGNLRFVHGERVARDYLSQASITASGQYPKAVVLGCVDSRVPPEIVLDQGIGDLFVGRIAGNFENEDLLGSLEFATKVAGSKVILVLGHTSCGAVKGAIDDVELGNLTALLNNLEDAIARADEEVEGESSSSNLALVDAAVEENVRQTVTDILAGSEIISEMVASGELLVVGGVYHLDSGEIDWFETS